MTEIKDNPVLREMPRTHSFQVLLLQQMIPILLVIILILSAFNGYQQKNTETITKQNERYVQELVQGLVTKLNQTFAQYQRTTVSIAKVNSERIAHAQNVQPILRDLQEATPFDHICYANDRGEMYYADGTVVDVRGEEFYQRGMKSGSDMILIPVRPRQKGGAEQLVSFFAPIVSEGSVRGVFLGSFEEASLVPNIMHVFYGEKAASAIIDSEGNTIINSPSLPFQKAYENGISRHFRDILEQNMVDEENRAKVKKAFHENAPTGFTCLSEDISTCGYIAPLEKLGLSVYMIFPVAAARGLIAETEQSGRVLQTGLVSIFVIYVLYLMISQLLRSQIEREKFRMARYVAEAVGSISKTIIYLDLERYTYENLANSLAFEANGTIIQFTDVILSQLEDEQEKENVRRFMKEEILDRSFHGNIPSVSITWSRDPYLYLNLSFVPVEVRDQMVTKCIVMFRDVTELKEKEEEDKNIIRQQLEIVSALSRDYVNIYRIYPQRDELQALKIEGIQVDGLDREQEDKIYSYQDSFSSYINTVVHADDREKCMHLLDPDMLMEQLGESGECKGMYRCVHDNKLHHVQYKVVASENREMVIVGFQYIDDIVEHEREIERARKIILEGDTILASAGFGTWTITLESGKRPRMACNFKMREILGIGENLSEEAAYRYWEGRIGKADLKAVRSNIRDMIAGNSLEITFLWKHPQLGEIYVRCGGTLFVQEEGKFVARGYFGDVTEVVRKEQRYKEELERSVAEAKRANAAKSSFLARMSHDIRTPLNGIIGMIAVNEKHADDIELMKENRVKAKVAANHLLALINDVLDMSKLEDGTVELAREPFDVVKMFEEILMVNSSRAEERNVEMSLEISQKVKEHPYVFGSPLHVRQIFMNIVGNAVKYNREGGEVRVSVKSTPVDERHVNHCVSVSDNGFGMSKEFLKHIYEPFTQERDSARSKFEGTGLGMSIVRALVDKMGGTIQIQSKPDEGSTFTISLTYELAEQSEVEKALYEEQEADISGIRILLAEDNELNAEIAQVLLEDAGAHVQRVKNGREAVEVFAAAPKGTFQVILMDIMMPEMNGLDASRAIRALKREEAKDIPILAMTANAFAEDVKNCLEAGMNGHLSKPLDLAKVTGQVAKVCGKRGIYADTNFNGT